MGQQETQIKRPDHCSYSQISAFSQCAFLWKSTRCLGIQQEYSPPATRGVYIHNAIDKFTKIYLEGGTCNSAVLRDILYESVCDPKIGLPISDSDVNICLKTLTDAYNYGTLDFTNTVSSEYPFDVPFEGTRLWSRVDRIDIKNDVTIIVDYKSGYFFPTEEELLSNLEFCIYAYALSQHPALHNELLLFQLVNVTNNKKVTVPCDWGVVASKMDYCRSIVKAMQTWTEFKPNPGTACSQYGGCFLGSYCANNVLKKLDKDNPLDDLSTIDKNDIVTLLANLTKVNGDLRKKIKNHLLNVGDLPGVGLSSRKVTVQNNEAIKQLIDTFAVDPTSFMTINVKKFHNAIGKRRTAILDQQDDNTEFLLQTLDEIEQAGYTHIDSGQDIKFTEGGDIESSD